MAQVSAEVEFARRLAEPAFRSYLVQQGWEPDEGERWMILSADTPWDSVRYDDDAQTLYAARQDDRFPFGWEIRFVTDQRDFADGPQFCPQFATCRPGQCQGFCRPRTAAGSSSGESSRSTAADPKDPSSWMTSQELGRLLMAHRDNDVRVDVDGITVPIASAAYSPDADMILIKLVDGVDLAVALTQELQDKE